MDTMARDRVHMYLFFCVNLKLWEIISFTLKSNYYAHVAVSGLQYICWLTKLLLQAKNFFIDNYVLLTVCLHFKNRLKYMHASLIGI